MTLQKKYDQYLLREISKTGPQSLYSALVSDYCELQNFCDVNWAVFENIAIVCHCATLVLRGALSNEISRVEKAELFISYLELIIHSISKVPSMKMKVVDALTRYRNGKLHHPQCKNKCIESLQIELAYFIALKSWSEQTFFSGAKERFKDASAFLKANRFRIIAEHEEIVA